MTNSREGISTILFLHNNNGSGTAAKISSSKGLVLAADVDANSGGSQSFISFETDNSEKLRIPFLNCFQVSNRSSQILI